jgi:hypothetical protein
MLGDIVNVYRGQLQLGFRGGKQKKKLAKLNKIQLVLGYCHLMMQ